jgi:hypothetical protein
MYVPSCLGDALLYTSIWRSCMSLRSSASRAVVLTFSMSRARRMAEPWNARWEGERWAMRAAAWAAGDVAWARCSRRDRSIRSGHSRYSSQLFPSLRLVSASGRRPSGSRASNTEGADSLAEAPPPPPHSIPNPPPAQPEPPDRILSFVNMQPGFNTLFRRLPGLSNSEEETKPDHIASTTNKS